MNKSILVSILASVAMGATANAAGSSDSLKIGASDKSSVLFTSEQAESAVLDSAGSLSDVSAASYNESAIIGTASVQGSDFLFLDISQNSGSKSAAGKKAKNNDGPVAKTVNWTSGVSAGSFNAVATSDVVVALVDGSGQAFGWSYQNGMVSINAIDGASVDIYNGSIQPSVNGALTISGNVYQVVVIDASGAVYAASVNGSKAVGAGVSHVAGEVNDELLLPVSKGVSFAGNQVSGGISHLGTEIKEETIAIGVSTSNSVGYLADDLSNSIGFVVDGSGAISAGSSTAVAVSVNGASASYAMDRAEQDGSLVALSYASGNLVVSVPSAAVKAGNKRAKGQMKSNRAKRAKRKILAVISVDQDTKGASSELHNGALQN